MERPERTSDTPIVDGAVDVDRAQIRQQLAMTPDERLRAVVNLSRTLATARRID